MRCSGSGRRAEEGAKLVMIVMDRTRAKPGFSSTVRNGYTNIANAPGDGALLVS